MNFSIVICSRKEVLLKDFINNIDETIGCEHELIVIDNSQNKYSIFEAYSSGIKKSNGKIICFLHDDILIHTVDWGIKIQKIFEENLKIGVLGIAGAKIKTKMPSAWWDCEYHNKAVHIIQHYPEKYKDKVNYGFNSDNIVEVATIDGVFIAMRNNGELQFNNNLKGFHNYDMDISLNCIEKGYKVYVTNQILIEHFSLGTLDDKWLNSSFEFHNLNKGKLPIIIGKNNLNKKLEIKNAILFINKALELKNYKIANAIWLKLLILNPFLKFHIKFLLSKLKNIFQ